MDKKIFHENELAETKEEIFKNAETLHGYLFGRDENKKQFALDLIKNGRVFCVTEIGGQLFFAPSRFIGYKENTMDRHGYIKNTGFADGTLTTPRICKILEMENKFNYDIEQKFLRFCGNFGMTAKKYSSPRTYWFTQKELREKANTIADEIAEIQKFLKNNSNISAEDKERIVKVRVGQGKIRNLLLSERHHCALCEISQQELLVASHIKPWAKCKDEEKGDLDNLLLLCAMHDALFDKGFISFDDEGKILVSPALDDTVKKLYGIKGTKKIAVTEKMKQYLAEHRTLFGFNRAE